MAEYVHDRQARRFKELLRDHLDLDHRFVLGDVTWDTTRDDAEVEVTALLPIQEVATLFNQAGRETTHD